MQRDACCAGEGGSAEASLALSCPPLRRRDALDSSAMAPGVPINTRMMPPRFTVVLALLALMLPTVPVHAQRRTQAVPSELRGSRESVEKMYRFAADNRMTFYLTPMTLERGIAENRLVPLTGGATYELTRGVGFSYATREARDFVSAFAPQYLAACGSPLTVTSAARPYSRQPRNANPHSVHPTGIAVDLRKPFRGPCLTWVRSALAKLENDGIIEATEERRPAHLHLAVLVAPGRLVTLPDLSNVVATRAQVPTTMVNASSNDMRVGKAGRTVKRTRKPAR